MATIRTKVSKMHEAELYWDRQGDPEGWWCRYRDDNGTEQGAAVEASEDASIEELAAAVDQVSHWLDHGMIKVIRGERDLGRITIRGGGEKPDWRAS